MELENPYFGIFKGEAVSLKKILGINRGYKISVDQKVGDDTLVGQYTLEGDCILRLRKPLNSNGNGHHPEGNQRIDMITEVLSAPIYQPSLFIHP